MKEFELKQLLENNELVDERIRKYITDKILFRAASKSEIQGHIAKAQHNLNFLNEIKEEYDDWSLIVCYYTVYQMALSLILTKGYFSKNHDATLCILIKHFHKKQLTEEDFKLLNSFDTEDILFYVQSKQEREKASYSSKVIFDKNLVTTIKLKTKLFLNKAKEIIENTI